MGELRDDNYKSSEGLWARSYARNMKIDKAVESRMNVYGFETGYDHRIYSDKDNIIFLGAMAGYIYTDNIRTKMANVADGKGNANSVSLGAYSTWIHRNG